MLSIQSTNSGSTTACLPSTVSISALDTSQLPPDLAARVNAQIGRPRTVEACMTAEEIDHPERMLAQVPAGCRYDHYKMAGGEIDGRLQCTGDAGSQEMIVQGTYGNDRYAMTITNHSNAAAGAPVLAGPNSTMKVESHRLGDCAAKKPA